MDPKSDQAWADSFVGINVSTLSMVTPFRLWTARPAEECIRIWLAKASNTLQRVEMWSKCAHVALTDDFHIGQYWTTQIEQSDRIKYVFVKGEDDVWNLKGKDERMTSGPDVETLTCGCN